MPDHSSNLHLLAAANRLALLSRELEVLAETASHIDERAAAVVRHWPRLPSRGRRRTIFSRGFIRCGRRCR